MKVFLFRLAGFLSTAVLTVAGFAYSAIAAPFAPGETLDPGCLPSDSTCKVINVSVATSTGNFGVGTTSPYAKLSVVGEIVGAYFTGTTTATSTFGGSIAVNSVGTSTFANGINIAGGCFAVNGTCLSGSGSGSVGGGTQGQLGFYNSAGSALTATSSIFLAQSGNVGIGTTSPSAKLEVSGASSLVTSPIMRITSTGTQAPYTFSLAGIDQAYVKGDNAGILAFGAKDDIVFEAGGFGDAFEKARITNSGNFGLGTTSPGATLSVAGTSLFDELATFRNGIKFQTTAQGARIIDSASDWLVISGSGVVDSGTDIAIPYGDNGDDFYIGYGTTQNEIKLGATGEEFVVTVGGKIGIGTSSPYAKLSVAGDGVFDGMVRSSYFVATSTATSTFTNGINIASGCFAVNNTCTGTVGAGTTGLFPYYGANGSTLSATSTLFLSTTGRVGVGTTSPYSRLTVWGGTIGNLFEVVTSASSTALRVSATGFGTTTLSGLSIVGSATSTSNVGINLTSGCFAINGSCVGGAGGGGSGTVNSSTATYVAFYSANGTAVSGTSTLQINTDGSVGIGGTGNGTLHGYDDNAAGDLTVRAGDGNGGGDATFRAGDGATGGNVTLRAGSGNSLSGGNVTINAGDDAGGGTPGTVTIRGGEAGVGGGGAVTLRGGDADTGGAVTIRAGNGTGSQGGTLTLSGGTDSATGASSLTIAGGSGGNSGAVTLMTGTGEATGNLTIKTSNGAVGSAGDITIFGGNAAAGSISRGSDITIYPGLGDGEGRNGNVFLGWTGAAFRGLVSVGSSTPFAGLSVAAALGQPSFAVGSSTTQFIITENGRVGIGTSSPFALLSLNGGANSDGTTWNNASSRALKENFTTLDPEEVIAKIRELSIPEWNYKSQSVDVRHVGPIAEEFYEKFGLGGPNANQSISSIDPAGIALLAIQGLDLRFAEFNGRVPALGLLDLVVEGGRAVFGTLFAKKVVTDELCIEDVCVNKAQLAALLAQNSQSSSGGSSDSGSTGTPAPTETDTTAPVLTLIGSTTLSVPMGTVFADMGATATDNVDQSVEVVQTVNDVNTTVAGMYSVTYTATDTAGNTASITRTVVVGTPDTAPEAQNDPAPEPEPVVAEQEEEPVPEPEQAPEDEPVPEPEPVVEETQATSTPEA